MSTLSTDFIEATIRAGMERARRNNSSYRYELTFSTKPCVEYLHILSEDHLFAVIFIPQYDKLFFGSPESVRNSFVMFTDELVGEESTAVRVVPISGA